MSILLVFMKPKSNGRRISFHQGDHEGHEENKCSGRGKLMVDSVKLRRSHTPVGTGEQVRKNDVQKTEIKRPGSQPSGKVPTDSRTGNVRIDPLCEAPEPARVRAA